MIINIISDLKVLLIGDTADNNHTLKKFSKKIEMYLIDFPKKQDGKFTNVKSDREYFKSLKISEQVKEINKIKSKFDLCLCLSWAAARVAYLAGINYLMYFVGDDITNPPFEKNTKPLYGETKERLENKNWIERRFYKKVFKSTIACIAPNHDTFVSLNKYRNDAIRFDKMFVDTDFFNENILPLKKEKTKFVFFSPQRIGPDKGIDKLWKAMSFTKSDYEVLQVEWFQQRTNEEIQYNDKLLQKIPKQVKLIPLIKREELGSYITYADCILGQMESGMQGAIERDSAFCKKPVLCYVDPKKAYIVDNEELIPPFEPKSNEPKIIAEYIDKIVESKEFREELIQKQFKFIKSFSDPEIVIQGWEEIFNTFYSKHPSINRKGSKILLLFENILFKIFERSVIKKYKQKNIEVWGQDEYERLMD